MKMYKRRDNRVYAIEITSVDTQQFKIECTEVTNDVPFNVGALVLAVIGACMFVVWTIVGGLDIQNRWMHACIILLVMAFAIIMSKQMMITTRFHLEALCNVEINKKASQLEDSIEQLLDRAEQLKKEEMDDLRKRIDNRKSLKRAMKEIK